MLRNIGLKGFLGQREKVKSGAEKREQHGDGGVGQQGNRERTPRPGLGHHLPFSSQPKLCFPTLQASRSCPYGRACPQLVENNT